MGGKHSIDPNDGEGVSAGRDAYLSGRDIHIHQHAAEPVPPPPGKRLTARTWWLGAGLLAVAGAAAGILLSSVPGSGQPSAASPVLTVTPDWPVLPGCDGATSIAVFSDGPAPAAVKITPGTDVRTTLAKEGAAFGEGTLTLTLTVTGAATAQIIGIRPVFYKQTTREPAWIYDPEGGCGDTYQRVFDLNLDRRTMTDLGTQGNPETLPSGSAKPATSQVGPSFHVSGDDPATISIQAHACSERYSAWGVQITYVIDGKAHVDNIGSAAAPFRVTGKPAQSVPAYTQPRADSPLARSYLARRPRSCSS